MQLSYTDNAREAIELAEKAAKELQQGRVETGHLLIGLLQEGQGVASRILRDNGITFTKVLEMVRSFLDAEEHISVRDAGGASPRVFEVLQEAETLALRFHSDKVGTEHILLGLIKQSDNVALRIIGILKVTPAKLYAETLMAMGQDPGLYKKDLSKKDSSKKGQEKKNQSMLDQFCRDMTAKAAQGKLDPCIGRKEEIGRIIQILSRRTKNNPCLIGEAGVGKTSVVEGLCIRIANGQVPKSMAGKRVLMLDMAGMIAGTRYRGEFEERIKRVMQEVVEDRNIILFMDELHTLIGAGNSEGSLDASNIMKPALARGELQLIGATTMAEYRKYIEKDSALERRFQPVNVEEPSEEEACDILEGIAGKYMEHHGVDIEPDALKLAVSLSQRYINDRNLPDKAVDVIDEACAAVRLASDSIGIAGSGKKAGHGNKKITPAEFDKSMRELDEQLEEALIYGDKKAAAKIKRKMDRLSGHGGILQDEEISENDRPVVGEKDIRAVVSMWTKVPLSRLEEKESERLLRLEDTLHGRVIGQDEAVSAVARAMRRGRVGLQDSSRPIGSFLFLGPTGVGKTELSKALAQAMFGSENALIRVDMSEYMEGHSVAKMIGSPPGYVGFDDGGQLSEKVRRNPYSVVLFDEVEKAHPDVFNVLLQVLDDGHITDSKGRKVSFKNTVLIMTSNAGASKIVAPKNLGFNSESSPEKDHSRMKDGVMEEVKRIFKPEFINRIDEMIVFHALSRENMEDIVNLLSSDLKKRCIERMNIELKFTPSLKKHLVDKYSDYKMGARPLKRAIQTVVEDRLAEEILKGSVKTGDCVSAGFKKGEVVFTTTGSRN